MCPWHVGRAILSVIWEDDIKPAIVSCVVGISFVLMGIVFGTIVVLFTLLLYKVMSVI